MRPRLGRSPAGKTDDFCTARRVRQLRTKSTDGIKSAVKIHTDRRGPIERIGLQRSANFAVHAGACDQSVDVWPCRGHGPRHAFDLAPLRYVAARSAKVSAMRGLQIGLARAGETPHLVAATEPVLREQSADAAAGPGNDDVHFEKREALQEGPQCNAEKTGTANPTIIPAVSDPGVGFRMRPACGAAGRKFSEGIAIGGARRNELPSEILSPKVPITPLPVLRRRFPEQQE